jgi:hypothetical protein
MIIGKLPFTSGMESLDVELEAVDILALLGHDKAPIHTPCQLWTLQKSYLNMIWRTVQWTEIQDRELTGAAWAFIERGFFAIASVVAAA